MQPWQVLDDLLIRSYKAHLKARNERFEAARKQWPLVTPQPDLVKARQLRLDAVALDPDRREKAWRNEQQRVGSRTIHEELLAFYDRMLGPVSPPEPEPTVKEPDGASADR